MMKLQRIVIAVTLLTPVVRADEEHDDEGTEAARVSHDALGRVVVTLDAETQERIGLAVTAVSPATLTPSMTAYGRLELDPKGSFTLRCPMTGYVEADPESPWPGIGSVLQDGATVGAVHPRFTAIERFDLRARLMDARAEVEQTTAELSADRASYENKKKLNSAGKVVSDRVMEEAEAKVKVDETRLATAGKKVKLIEEELSKSAEVTERLSLRVDTGGEVIEVLAQPGEAVESGQALLRVARTDRLIARVELPLGNRLATPINAARIVPVGGSNHVLTGSWLGWAPSVDMRTLGQGILLSVKTEDPTIRPGMAVAAYVPGPGTFLTGVTMPRSAIVRYGGLSWVYVRQSDDTFVRRDVSAATPTESGYFLASNATPDGRKLEALSAGDHVVTTAAQLLLSEELKAQIEMEAAAEE